YTVQDNGTTNGVADPQSATATVSFLIAEVNSPPITGNDSLASIAEDSAARTISFASLLANDVAGPISEAGQSMTITSVGSTVGGTVAIVGTDVIFTPAANYNGPASFVYTVQDNGTTAGNPDPQSATGSVSFAITEVNDAPTASNDTLADVINTGPVSIPINSLLGNDSPGPANEASQTLSLVSISNVSGGTAAIVGSDIVFTPTAGLEAPGGFQYTITDNGTTAGVADPLTAVGTVSFNIISPPNIPPAIDLNGAGVPGTSYPAVMTLIGGTVSVVNAATTTVVDPDTDILSGTITITNRLDGASEVLAVNTAGTSLAASFNSATGVLTLTGLATPAEYQQVIRTTTYTNLSFNPTMSPDRVIQFVLDDGEDLSNVAEATVNYAIVPSPPVVDLDGSASVNFGYASDYLTYNGPVKIAAADATLIDTSNVYLSSLTVTLVTPSDGLQEVLAANTTGTPITSSYAMNGLNAVLTLTGLGTVAQYEQVLRTVTYDNTADLPTIQSRFIKVVANDGTFDSSERVTTLNVIAVNGKPKVTTTSGTTAYVRGNLAGAVVDAGLTVSDPGGVQFQSATIAITSGFVPGIDRLSYNGAGGIPSSFNSTTGVLTLTGFTSIANYQTALRAIKFVTLSSAAVGPRTISFSVRDVTAATNGHLWSDPATKTVNVTAAELATVTNFDAVVPVITNQDLRPIVAEAIARWQNAGASPSQIALLRNTPVTIEDLDASASLGTTDGQSITLDDDAAGIGWFVDSTPRSDREFDERVGRFERQADDGEAAGKYDLLTVMMHEFGHVLGLDDLDSSDVPHQLMTGELTLGTRRLTPLGHRGANGETIWFIPGSQQGSDDCDDADDTDRSTRNDLRLRREVLDRLFAYWS
ncbi:MAG: cadherin-like domain-containing protein, partial [Planctomycetaceae bacterium]|nr:cadherin-like domain-containing protein [Planctomycetaceae bacterium]